MTEIYWSYDTLKKLVIEDGMDIEEIKTLLYQEIGSKRRYDCISCVEDLFDCLERSDELAEDNVEVLHRISSNQPRLKEALNAYTPQAARELVNIYQEQRLAEELRDQLRIGVPQVARASGQTAAITTAPPPPVQMSTVPAAFTDRKRAAVFKKISEELGRFWRRLGRAAGIGEGSMDNIEGRYPHDLKSQILRLLQMIEEDDCHDPKHFLIRLCRALGECGRNDLRKNVEQIMSY